MGALIIQAIKDGLAIVAELGTALNSGFNSAFVETSGQTTALTNVGTFAFILLGLGMGVGLIKLVFHWITGRHGM